MEWNELYKMLELGDLEGQVQALYPQWEISFFDMIKLVIEGRGIELLGKIQEGIWQNLNREWTNWKSVIITIAIVILISAVFSSFKGAFKNQQIEEIAFHVNYLILIILFTSLFQQTLKEAEDTLIQIKEFMQVFFPAYFLVLGIAAGTATGVVYYQLACLVIYGVEIILEAFLLPAVSGYVLFSIMNGIWEESRLLLLLELWRKGIKAGLRLLLGILTGAGLIQSMITPVIERIKTEAVYKTVEALPGVGELTEGVMRLWLGSAVLIKNSVGIIFSILLLGITLFPLLKIAAAGCILKGMAAVLGIAGDKRMIQLTNNMGDGILLLLKTVAYGILFFLVLIAITAYTTNGGF